MRVLQVINSLNTGGAEKLLLDIIPLLNERGLKTDLLILDSTRYPYLIKLEENNCCTIHSLNSKNIYNPINIFKLLKYFRKYDLLHVHLFPAQYWVAFGKLISFSRCKLIFTEHNTTNKRMKNKFFKFFEKFIYKIYNKTVCISVEIRDILINYTGDNCDKFIVIKNGINLDEFGTSRKIRWSEINAQILDSDLVLTQVAAFRPQKDQMTSIKSMKLLMPNVKLVLVGDGEQKSELESLVKRLNLENRVFFLGVRLDVPNLLKSSFVSVVSSHWEGMPLSVIESMAAGIPVVASDVPGVKELVSNIGVLFEKSNEKHLAEIINQLIDDKSYYKNIANRCYLHSKEFDISRMLDSLVEEYQNILK